ncbi:MAG: DUF1285 domain-containing protein [Alphaproteobacteria bacterium]|nr:DUF1285 domain-containing protein [Alphaproteobacteria bacterium]
MNDQPQERTPERNPGAPARPARRVPRDCGDFAIRIARDGTWYYEGSPIARPALVRLFSTVLKRDADGVYWLETPVEKGRVEVEDAPFTAVELAVAGRSRDRVLQFRTNVDTWIEAGPDHPIRVTEDPQTREPRPYLLVRDGLEALIVRSVYYELVALGVEEKATFGVWSKNAFFALGPAGEAP